MKATQVTIRFQARLREDHLLKRLRRAASESGHSLNDEIATRLVASFDAADKAAQYEKRIALYEKRVDELLQTLNTVLRDASRHAMGRVAKGEK